MSRLLSLFSFCLVFAIGSVAQVNDLRGKVLDAITLEPLPYASVFINGTTLGVNANESGVFMLPNVPEGEFELVCSYVGHQTYQLKLRLPVSGDIEIKLKPLELKEIEVTGKKDEQWKSQLKEFETFFLGPGKSTCKILNPWVLDFVEISDNVLVAKASAPIEIENLGLGYSISYTLKDFVVSPNAYNISGFTYFKEIKTDDPKLSKRWKENRAKSYQSSPRHLIKSILDDKVRAEGFELYEDQNPASGITRSGMFNQNLGNKLTPYKTSGTFVPRKTRGEYAIKFPSRIEVHYLHANGNAKYYQDINHAVGWIEVNGGELLVNSQGIALNPANLIVSGYLSEARVARSLPNNFDPENMPGPPLISTGEKINKKLIQLREQPYVHTDKAYYYPGEIIWMKVYMNYAAAWKRDSLSKVLYVDLINNKKIVDRKILSIENGMSVGTIKVPKTLATGDYFIRAYTRWIQNYGDSYVFLKPVKVLSLDESIKHADRFKTESSGLSIIPDKNTYSPGDKITLKVTVTDSLSKPMQGNLSVSVTDMQLAVPVTDEKTILSHFPIHAEVQGIIQKYPIEYGISINGKFFNNKGVSDKGLLTVAEETLKNVFTLSTNNDGVFAISNLHFYDSIKLAINGKGSNGKRGSIKIESATPKTISETLTPLQAEVKTQAGGKQYHVVYTDDTLATLLPEVTIENKSLEDKRLGIVHGTPDVTISGDWLRSTHSNNLLMSLMSRVPGLRVFSFVGTDGIVQYKIRFRTPSSLMDTDATPLVLINNIPVFLPPNDLAQYLMTINPQEIDRVEVIKYGTAAAYGARGTNGIIAIYMKLPLDEANTDNTFDPKDFQVVSLTGYSSPYQFKPIDNAQQRSSSEDTLTTIYWNPLLETNAAGEAVFGFYITQRITSYRIIIEGVTVSGEPVRGEKIIEIVK